MLRHGRTIFLAVFAVLLFSACSRRPADEAIANQIKAKYFSDPAVKMAILSVAVRNGKVTLSGNVSGADVHLRAFQLAYGTAGVAAIDDRIAVTPPEAAVPDPTPAPVRAAALPPQPDPEPVDRPAAGPPVAQPEETAAVQAPRPLAVRIRNPPVQVHVTTVAAQPAPPPPADDPAPVAAEIAAASFVRVDSAAAPGGVRAARRLARAVTIEAAGAPAGFEVYENWFARFKQWQRDASVHAMPQGFTFALKALRERSIDLAFSDMPLTDDEVAALKSRPWHFPVLLDAVVPNYNLPGLKGPVNFTPEALAGIFLGRITRWNDPILAAANPQLALPPAGIVPVHRSDACAATFVWTDYLSRVSPEWRALYGANRVISRPMGTGARGDAGVAGLVRQTPYSVGYLDMAYAIQQNLPFGRVRNSSGDFVMPSPAAVAAAAFPPYGASPDGRVSLTNSQSKAAYPIAMFHWFILPADPPDRVKRDAVGALMQWVLTAGQSMTTQFGYVPIPQAVVASELQELQRRY